jgi:3-oxoadipate enol-lactonase
VTATLANTISGAPGSPVVVMGSSLGTTQTMWEPQVAALAEHYRVIRYDHRGHGGSEMPPAPYRIADLGGDVIGLLDSLGVDRFSFVGLSLGGMTGMWVASEIPQRVDRLALLSTSAALGAPDAWYDRAAKVRAGGLAAVAHPVIARWFTPAYAAANPAIIDEQIAGLLTVPVDGYAACCEAIAEMDLRDRLARINAPTVAIAATQDLAIPPVHSEAIVAAIAGARLELIDHAAHIANIEQPAAVTRLLLQHLGE